MASNIGATLKDIGEKGFLTLVQSLLDRGNYPLTPGMDDCFVDDVAYSRIVLSSDSFVEGVHFKVDVQHGEEIGWRALCLSLSDLASCGALPAYALCSIAVPGCTRIKLIEQIYRGIQKCAKTAGCLLVGGDTTAAPNDFVISLAVVGFLEKNELPMLREQAQPGDLIGLTGPLGMGILYEEQILKKSMFEGFTDGSFPRPPIDEGRILIKAGVRCAGDISDGLVSELERIADASHVGYTVELERLKLFSGVEDYAKAAISGEEPVLVFCCSPEVMDELRSMGFYDIGRIIDDPNARLISMPGGAQTGPGDFRGYEHFRERHIQL
jgi:thiamine-monophosphate kinase